LEVRHGITASLKHWLRYVLPSGATKLQSPLLGAVFELLYHDVRKQQILRIARIKYSFKVKVETKRPSSYRAPQHLFGSILSRVLGLRPLGWFALYSSNQAPQADKIHSRGLCLCAAISMTRTRAPLCRLKWRCSAIYISRFHIPTGHRRRRPMQRKTSAIRDPVQPNLRQSKAKALSEGAESIVHL
jgi:hypothetical protein